MMEQIRLEIDELAPSLNGRQGLVRMHWTAYRRQRDRWRLLIRSQLSRSLLEALPLQGPLEILIRRRYAVHPLDLDNLYAASKLVLDALRYSRVIVDDDPEVVRGLSCRQVKIETRREEATEILIYRKVFSQEAEP